MSKPYRDADLSSQLSHDRGWRLREISDLKSAILQADARLQKVLLRSLVAICYAHWEGSVRFAARKYLEYIALRKMQYAQLDRQFLKNHFLPRLTVAIASKTSVAELCSLVDDILDGSERRFTKMNEELVNTRSNLNFDVFRDICLVCGLEIAAFADREPFIDVMLLKRRNAVAHGEDTFVGIEDLDILADQTIGLMRTFGDALENRVYLRGYRAA